MTYYGHHACLNPSQSLINAAAADNRSSDDFNKDSEMASPVLLVNETLMTKSEERTQHVSASLSSDQDGNASGMISTKQVFGECPSADEHMVGGFGISLEPDGGFFNQMRLLGDGDGCWYLGGK